MVYDKGHVKRRVGCLDLTLFETVFQSILRCFPEME